MTIRLVLPFPPSVNNITTIARGRKITSKAGREYRTAAIIEVRRQHYGKPLSCRLYVKIDLYPKDRRRRDVDNYSKAILDALTAAHVFLDDDQIDHLEIIKHNPEKPGRCIVTIEELNG